MTVLRVRLNAVLFLGAISMAATVAAPAQQHDPTPVDKEVTTEEVLRLVDPQYPGLQDFAAAMGAGDLLLAQKLLVKHFATRAKPVVPPAEFPGVSEGNSMTVIRGSADRQRADDTWMKHIFTLSNNDEGKSETYDLGAKIDWMKNPSKALSWILYLNQLNHLAGLAGLYRDTREEKYAAEIGESVSSWTKQCPRWYGYTNNGTLTPSGMEVRNRLCNLIATYDIVRKSPSLTPERHLAFWKMFIACARELMTYEGVSYPGLIPAAVMFPEFTEHRKWLKAGEDNLRFCLVDRTSPEGAWDTHSISYQDVPVPWAARVLEFLRANPGGDDFAAMAQMVKTQIGKLLGLMLYLTMPNHGLPNIGDTYGRTDWGDAVSARLSSFIFSQMSAEDQARLNKIADRFDRLKATLATAEGSGADEPTVTSVGFPGSGYYGMRSDWQPKEAKYLYFDLSPQAFGHAHEDACHFDLYAYGKPLLVDTGDYFLGWGYRTALHNTIEVDGQSQARNEKAPMMPTEWLTTRGFDFVDGAHGAYEERGVVHRRKILFVKPDYFILCDLLTGTGHHRYEQFFHFAGPTQLAPARATLDPRTKVTASAHEGVANVQVVPAYIEDLQAGFVEPQDTDMKVEDKYERKAMLGWIVTGGTFQRVKSAVAVYTREGEAPQSFYEVLFPTPANAEAQVRVEHLAVISSGRSLDPSQAAGLAIHCQVRKPAHPPESIRMDLGKNLASGKPGFAEINQGKFGGTDKLLTDGDLGTRVIGAALASDPYTPNVLLTGRYGVDFGEDTEVNTVVLHHGTWNGATILYPAEGMTVQYWDGANWKDVANAQTAWQGEQITATCFDTVKTSRLSVAVERPSGGRLALREFEVHRVSEAERRRVESLRREMTTEQWADYFLISHEGRGQRVYGNFAFDGELALIRRDAAGKLTRLLVKTGREVSEKGQLLLYSDEVLDSFSAEWSGDSLDLNCPAPYGLKLLAQGATRVQTGDRPLTPTTKEGLLLLEAAERKPPVIVNVKVQQQPPQKGMAGAQPSALITWTTNEPATSQVEFSEGPLLVRRSLLDTRMTTDHRVQAHFLRTGRQYAFKVVSVNKWGLRAEASAG